MPPASPLTLTMNNYRDRNNVGRNLQRAKGRRKDRFDTNARTIREFDRAIRRIRRVVARVRMSLVRQRPPWRSQADGQFQVERFGFGVVQREPHRTAAGAIQELGVCGLVGIEGVQRDREVFTRG